MSVNDVLRRVVIVMSDMMLQLQCMQDRAKSHKRW